MNSLKFPNLPSAKYIQTDVVCIGKCIAPWCTLHHERCSFEETKLKHCANYIQIKKAHWGQCTLHWNQCTLHHGTKNAMQINYIMRDVLCTGAWCRLLCKLHRFQCTLHHHVSKWLWFSINHMWFHSACPVFSPLIRVLRASQSTMEWGNLQKTPTPPKKICMKFTLTNNHGCRGSSSVPGPRKRNSFNLIPIHGPFSERPNQRDFTKLGSHSHGPIFWSSTKRSSLNLTPTLMNQFLENPKLDSPRERNPLNLTLTHGPKFSQGPSKRNLLNLIFTHGPKFFLRSQ